MKKYFLGLTCLLFACGQKTIEMEIALNAQELFSLFVAKKKFVEENFYPGIADEKLRNGEFVFFIP